MRCPRCQSENLVQIGHLIYCRDCIAFGQIRPEDHSRPIPVRPADQSVHYELNYDLSPQQAKIAYGVAQAVANGQNVVIQAVCGSGKTELVYPAICQILAKGGKVGFSLPRRDLAIEIHERLSQQLKGVDLALVYGGHHDDCYQALVVCTTHQLFRYWAYFDLLIIDEVDAFPFAGNETLEQLAHSACKGQFILMSATAFETAIPQGYVPFYLNRRYHGHDLPVPCLIWCPDWLFVPMMVSRMKQLIRSQASCLVFVPVKADVAKVAQQLSFFGLRSASVYAGCPQLQSIFQQFRQHEISILVTTTLLERGITFENVHIFVYRAHHVIFNTATLIQIAGRAGRKPQYPCGEVYFVGRRLSKEMKACQKILQMKNA